MCWRHSKLCIIEPGATKLRAVANTLPRWKGHEHGNRQTHARAPLPHPTRRNRVDNLPPAHRSHGHSVDRARRICELLGFDEVAEIEPDLAEWDYGDYEGQRSLDIRKGRADWNLFRDGCPHGEMPLRRAWPLRLLYEQSIAPYRRKAPLPANLAAVPNSSSIRRNWLNFATFAPASGAGLDVACAGRHGHIGVATWQFRTGRQTSIRRNEAAGPTIASETLAPTALSSPAAMAIHTRSLRSKFDHFVNY